MRKEKESPQSQTEVETGAINSEKSGDKTASVTREILVDSPGGENEKIILSYIL